MLVVGSDGSLERLRGNAAPPCPAASYTSAPVCAPRRQSMRPISTRPGRVASLTVAAWIAFMRRLAFFYSHTVIDDVQLAVEQAHQHPDCPAA